MGEIADMYEDYAFEEMAKFDAEQQYRVEKAQKMEKEYMMGILKWGSLEGPVSVTSMSDSHIANCIEMIKRNEYSNGEISHKWVELFEIELEKRKK